MFVVENVTIIGGFYDALGPRGHGFDSQKTHTNKPRI